VEQPPPFYRRVGSSFTFFVFLSADFFGVGSFTKSDLLEKLQEKVPSNLSGSFNLSVIFSILKVQEVPIDKGVTNNFDNIFP
jgi:hypothetical protein